jgi:hypothetical protein
VVYEFGDGDNVVIAGDWGSGGEYHFIVDATGDPLSENGGTYG